MIVQTSLSSNRVCTNRPRDSFPTENTSLLTACTHLYVLTSSTCQVTKELDFLLLNVISLLHLKLLQTLDQDTLKSSIYQSSTRPYQTQRSNLKSKCLRTTTLPNSPSRAVASSVVSAMLPVVSLLVLEASHQVCLYTYPQQ